jgi:hypothetical protein
MLRERGDVVLDVLEDVVGDRGAVRAGLGRGEHQLADVHVRVAAEALLERDQAVGLDLRDSHAGDVRKPLRCVVTEPGAHLDRVVAQVRHRKTREPLPVVLAHRQALKDLGLDPLVAQDLRHPRSFPVVSHVDQYVRTRVAYPREISTASQTPYTAPGNCRESVRCREASG